MNFNSLKKILLTVIMVSLAQVPAFCIDDVWGSSMGITEDAVKQNTNSNTIFDASNTAPAQTQTPQLRQDTSSPAVTPEITSTSLNTDKENRTMKRNTCRTLENYLK